MDTGGKAFVAQQDGLTVEHFEAPTQRCKVRHHGLRTVLGKPEVKIKRESERKRDREIEEND